MGVEPTGDRAERSPSRFEDGGTGSSNLYLDRFVPLSRLIRTILSGAFCPVTATVQQRPFS